MQRDAPATAPPAQGGAPAADETRTGPAVFGGLAEPPTPVDEDGELELDSVLQYFEAVTAAFASATPAALSAETEAALRALSNVESLSATIKRAVIQLSDAANMKTSKGEDQPELPEPAALNALSAAIARLRGLRGPALRASPALSGAVDTASRGANEAVLACFQARTVASARARMASGVKEPTAAEWKAPGKPQVDPGFLKMRGNTHAGPQAVNPDGESMADWCGQFVVSNLVVAAGLTTRNMHLALFHASSAPAFFAYGAIPGKAQNQQPNSIKDDVSGKWMGLREYHEKRGSVRQMWADQTVQSGKYAGKCGDVRDVLKSGVQPGDVVVRDTHGEESGGPLDGKGDHYGMIETTPKVGDTKVTTIEGNVSGGRGHRDTAGTHENDRGNAGSNIIIVGRPSVCDFEPHTYSFKSAAELEAKAPKGK